MATGGFLGWALANLVRLARRTQPQKQLLETSVASKGIYGAVHSQPGQVGVSLFKCFVEPAEGVIVLAQVRVNCREEIRWHVHVAGKLPELFQSLECFRFSPGKRIRPSQPHHPSRVIIRKSAR